MSRFKIEKAVRRGNKARVALAAPAGGGKTYTALILAKELAEGGDVLVIDTERGSASLYADQFEFQTIKWEPPYDPRELAKLLAEVGRQFSVIVVDSLSHFWMGEGGTLDIVSDAGAKAKGNTYAGWKEGTPAQTEMVDAMLNCPAHVLVTMRSKTEYVLEQRNGKNVPTKVGMAPVQRDGIEYEFTVTAEMDVEHRLMVAKSRCSVLEGKVFKAGHAAEMGKVLHDWLDGAEAEASTRPPVAAVPDPPRPSEASASDEKRQALADRIADLDDRDRERIAGEWQEAKLPPLRHPDFNTLHVSIAAEMIEAVEVESFDRRRKHVSAKMNEVGVKTEQARHELMRHATDGRTESSKRLARVDVDAIVAYCQRMADEDAKAAS